MMSVAVDSSQKESDLEQRETSAHMKGYKALLLESEYLVGCV